MSSILKLLPLLFFLISVNIYSQNRNISGILVNEQQGELFGAHLFLKNLKGKTTAKTISNELGYFIFGSVKTGKYRLHISHIGFKDYQQEIEIDGANLDLKTIQMKEETIQLKGVVVKGIQKRAEQLNDTIQFNSKAYKTNPDATAEDLLQKMPGFQVINGKAKAQGEDIVKVLVDGKPFFGDDPNTALKNLPAEVISKIQVFDQESEESQASGFSDGNTQKTVNIILSEKFKNGVFGKVNTGYGTEDTYSIGGNINIFNGDQRLTILGQSNNINIQNFSTTDLLGVSQNSSRRRGGSRGGRGGGRQRGNGGASGRGGSRGGSGGSISGNTSDFLVAQQGGLNTINAFGINFQDSWSDKIDIVASYFFNKTKNENESLLIEDFFNLETPYVYNEAEKTRANNINHRFNFQFQYRINKKNTITLKPSLAVQQNEGINSNLSQTQFNEELPNILSQALSADFSAVRFSNKLLFRHQFEKRGRVLSFNLSNGFNTSKGDKLLNADTSNTTLGNTFINQTSTLDNIEESWKSGITFLEPITQTSSVFLGYGAGNQLGESELFTNDFNENTNVNEGINEDLSSVFNNDYFSQNLNVGYRYRKAKLIVGFKVEHLWSNLENQQFFPSQTRINKQFNNFQGNGFLRYRLSKSDYLKLFYRTNTQLPTINNLQNVIDNSNPLQLIAGNPNLDRQLNHSLGLRYSSTNTKGTSIFFGYAAISSATDYIGENTIVSTGASSFNGLSLDQGVQLQVPINLSNYWTARGFLSYGFPVKKIKSNLNLNLEGNFNNLPSQLNSITQLTQTKTLGFGIVLSSNISENIDFTINISPEIQFIRGDFLQNSELLNNTAKFKMNLLFLKNWKLETSITNTFYEVEEASNENITLWNLSLGRKLFKENRGEISIRAFDLLNDNRTIQRVFTQNSFQETSSLALNRFFMLNFTYNIRSFKEKKK